MIEQVTPTPGEGSAGALAFQAARMVLLNHAHDPVAAHAAFRWPQFDTFNWALDVFAPLAASLGDAPALFWAGGRSRTPRSMRGRTRSRASWQAWVCGVATAYW